MYGFRRVNPAASLKLSLATHAAPPVAQGFRRVNPAASLKQRLLGIGGDLHRVRFRRVNPAASLKQGSHRGGPSVSPGMVSAG